MAVYRTFKNHNYLLHFRLCGSIILNLLSAENTVILNVILRPLGLWLLKQLPTPFPPRSYMSLTYLRFNLLSVMPTWLRAPAAEMGATFCVVYVLRNSCRRHHGRTKSRLACSISI